MTDLSGKPYTFVGVPYQRRQFSDVLQEVEDGWVVRAQWHANGAIITVFVPSNVDLATTADKLIQAQGQALNALHTL